MLVAAWCIIEFSLAVRCVMCDLRCCTCTADFGGGNKTMYPRGSSLHMRLLYFRAALTNACLHRARLGASLLRRVLSCGSAGSIQIPAALAHAASRVFPRGPSQGRAQFAASATGPCTSGCREGTCCQHRTWHRSPSEKMTPYGDAPCARTCCCDSCWAHARGQ